MTKAFEAKVIYYGCVDTKTYRYYADYKYDHIDQWIEIQRIPLSYLGTTAEIDGWETVKVIGKRTEKEDD